MISFGNLDSSGTSLEKLIKVKNLNLGELSYCY